MNPLIWLLKDFELLSILLRALTLATEALTLGGLGFLFLVVPPGADPALASRVRRYVGRAALALALAQAAATTLSVITISADAAVPLVQMATANFVLAGAVAAACALLIAVLLHSSWPRLSLPFGLGLLAATVALSHAAARMEDRPLLLALTAAHHLGTAGWVGAMVFLLLGLRRAGVGDAIPMARRYSRLAMVSVPLLVSAGVGLGYVYIHSWSGLYGTSYGALVIAKTYLVLTMLLLGGSNQRLLQTGSTVTTRTPGTKLAQPGGLLLRLRRFSEAEIGLGFTAILAAASLTSQAPAADLGPLDRLTAHEIVERFRWQAPRLSSPPLSALAPPNSLEAALPAQQFGSGSVSDANDRAWSEYNHHWAGLIVLGAAVLALAYRTAPPSLLRRFARNWPLLFLGLAVFILLRADPENWPLGPRPFWASFSRPDVLEHRLYALLITAFALFEWAVERGRIRTPRAAYFFPLACAAGGAALLTHSHGMGDMHEEMLAGLSHTLIALLGATAGWGRWLELRLPGRPEARWAGRVWPVCLLLVGLVLMDYREA